MRSPLPAIMTVLADFCDQDARRRPSVRRIGAKLAHALDRGGHPGFLPVDARDRLGLGRMTAEHRLQCRRYLADGGARSRGVDRKREQVLVAAARLASQRRELIATAFGSRSRRSR